MRNDLDLSRAIAAPIERIARSKTDCISKGFFGAAPLAVALAIALLGQLKAAELHAAGFSYGLMTTILSAALDDDLIEIEGPDLRVEGPEVDTSSLILGQSFVFSASTRNFGNEPAPDSVLRYYLSADPLVNNSDQLVGTDIVSTIAPGESESDSISVTTSQIGNYWIGACIDPVEGELYTGNQCSFGAYINVDPIPAPDLTLLNPSVLDNTVESGEAIAFSVTSRNQGTGNSIGTTIRYYLSSDQVIDSGDTQIDTGYIGGLVPGGATSSNITAGPLSDDIYWIGACIDPVAGEQVTSNQCSAGVQVVVGPVSGFECSDGIDNDDDGLTDFGMDLGCADSLDATEGGLSTGSQENGWTVFEPSSDSRIIFVSSSMGNDGNNGLSEHSPVQSISRAKSLLRDGFPDWVLFKRGDTWTEGLGQLTKSGRSMSEPIVYGAYGSGTERPRILEDNGPVIFTSGGGSGPAYTDYNVFVELYFSTYRRDPDHPDFDPSLQRYIISWLRGTRGLHFEDVVFQWGELSLTPFDGFPQRNIVFKRCQILDSWAPSSLSHAQGLYLHTVENILIDETLLDHNGWNEDASGGEKTIFNHNLYAGAPQGLEVRNSLSMRASSHGAQLRSGGVIENNLFVENAISIFFVSSNSNARIRDNVVLHGTDVSDSAGRGWGIDIENGGRNVVVRDNILSECSAGLCTNITGDTSNATFSGNVIYDWDGPFAQTPGPFSDPGRDIESYNQTQGRPGNIEDFATMMRGQSRMTWNDAYRIPVILDYIRSGFDQ